MIVLVLVPLRFKVVSALELRMSSARFRVFQVQGLGLR